MTDRIQDLVIGGGAIGVCTAIALAEAGRDVVLIEKNKICSGCSHGNAGWVTPCHSLPLPAPGLVGQSLKWMLRNDSPLYIKPSLRPSLLKWLWRFFRHCNPRAQEHGLQALASLNQHVVPMTRELVEKFQLDCEFANRGILYVFRSEVSMQKGVEECQFLNQHDIPGEIVSREEVLRREPTLIDSILGGVFYPDESDFVPDLFVKQLANHLEPSGVKLLEQTAVENFSLSGRKIESVTTSSGTLQAENVVLAAGAWSIPIARRLGISLSMQPGKGYSVTLDRQPGTPENPMNFSEAKMAVTPWNDQIRFAGTMELAGLQLKINQRRVDAIIQGAKRFLPEFRAENIREIWTGMRPVTSDGLPIIGRSSRVHNLIFATGHAMLGLTQAAVTARLVTDIIVDRSPLVSLAPFTPDRF